MENDNFDKKLDNDEIKPQIEVKSVEPKMSPVAAGFLGLLIVFFLYQFGGGILTILILGTDLKNADQISFRLLTAAGQILFILLPALVMSKAVYEDVTYIIRVRKPGLYETFLFVAGLIPVTLILQSYMYIQEFLITKIAEFIPLVYKIKEFLDQFDESLAETYISFLSAGSVIEYILIFFVVAIVPAVCEEFFFRGYVQKSFEFKFSPFISAVITALIFSFYHMHPYQFIPLAFIGLYLGIAAYYSNSIFVPVIIHFLNNTIAILMFFAGDSEDITSTGDISFENLNIAVMFFIVGILLFSVLLLFIKRFYKQKLS